MSTVPPFQGLTLGELADLFVEHGLSRHQARVVFQSMHRGSGTGVSPPPAASATCRKFLEKFPPLPSLNVDSVHTAEDGTVKLRLTTTLNSTPHPAFAKQPAHVGPLPQGER